MIGQQMKAMASISVDFLVNRIYHIGKSVEITYANRKLEKELTSEKEMSRQLDLAAVTRVQILSIEDTH